MAAATGLTIIKRFTYRGDTQEEFSNTYWFTGTAPATPADWRTLFNAVVATEKACYHSGVSVIKGYGYNDDDDHAVAVWTVDLRVAPDTPVAGTVTMAAGEAVAEGDCAVWARWKTDRLNTKGKAIWLRKYFHGVIAAAAADGDTLKTAQKTNIVTHATKMSDGTLTGSRTLTARGHTDTLTAPGASTYITTRTLKRRGKRPGS